jgi:Sec-independent protein translocase protein TatA
MSDLKSKLPDLNELGSMVGKLFGDIKNSVNGIIDDYKKKHPAETKEPAKTETKKSAAKTDEDKKQE